MEQEFNHLKRPSVDRTDEGGTMPEDAPPLKKERKFSFEADEGVSRVKTFEDLLQIIGTNGLWNNIAFILGCYCTFTCPMTLLSYQFLGAIPDYWCRVDPLIAANWTQQQVISLAIPNRTDGPGHERCRMYDYDFGIAVNLGYDVAVSNRHLLVEGKSLDPIRCRSRDFNFTQHESTLVTEWDLVCDRLSLYSTTQAAAHIGFLIGCIIFGYLLDLFGRRRVILACTLFATLTSACLVVAPDYQFYIILKTLTTIFQAGYYVGCFVNLMELCSLSQRSSVGCMFVIPFGLGFMAVPGIAYFVRPWRWLQAVYVIPMLPFLAYYWLWPESPRWLISQGRYEDALKVFTWAAKVNRRTLPPPEDMISAMKAVAQECGMQQPTTEMRPYEKDKKKILLQFWEKLSHFFVLVTTPFLRKRALICYFCWFAVSMVYYGVSLNSTNLSADPYLYVFLGGLTEIPAYLLLWPAIAYLGRRTTLIVLYVTCAIAISIIAIVFLAVDEAPVAAIMSFSLAGKLAITAAFHLLYVFTAELFPTKYRSLAVGESSMMARVGSMTSPYINDLLGFKVTWGPSALFAIISLMAAGLVTLLPETVGEDMVEATSNDQKKDKENGSLMKKDAEIGAEGNGRGNLTKY